MAVLTAKMQRRMENLESMLDLAEKMSIPICIFMISKEG